jgi:4-hydroxy-tetrahydrodipicolinate synthase
MTGNLIPREMAVISKKWESGEDAFACREAWLRNLEVLHFAYSAINPVAVKSLMAAIGLPAGPLRKPLMPLEGPALQVGLNALAALELDKTYGFKLPKTPVAAE